MIRASRSHVATASGRTSAPPSECSCGSSTSSHSSASGPVYVSCCIGLRSVDADERTRTSTDLRPHGPEPCASTNSATSARQRRAKISHALTRSAAAVAGSSRALCAGQPRAFLVRGSLLASSRSSAPLSSRGLGRRPLMAETRVRIPVAVLSERPRKSGVSAFERLGC